MIENYKGKSKCCCGKRARYRVIKIGSNKFACEEHLYRLEHEKQDVDNTRLTEADYQTWINL